MLNDETEDLLDRFHELVADVKLVVRHELVLDDVVGGLDPFALQHLRALHRLGLDINVGDAVVDLRLVSGVPFPDALGEHLVCDLGRILVTRPERLGDDQFFDGKLPFH